MTSTTTLTEPGIGRGAIVFAWPRVRGGVLAALALCGVCGFAATPSEPPPHRDVGQRLVPADVDWANPVYQTALNDPAELKDWKLEDHIYERGHDLRPLDKLIS